MEDNNRYLNKTYRQVNGRGRRTFDGWLATVQTMEYECITRVGGLKDPSEEYKQKNPEFADKDRWFASLVAKHQNGTLTPSAYFEEVVKKHNEYDLPKELREKEDPQSDESDSEESD